MKQLLSSITLFLFLITSSFSQLADTAWPMQSHDPQHTGRSNYNGPSTAVQKWTFTTGGPVTSSPVIATDGTIYVGSDDKKLYAVNPNGTKKWEFATGGTITTTPAIGVDGTIFVTSNDAIIYAINSDGTPKWNFKTGGVLTSSPVIDKNGIIYFGSADSKLYALDSNDGSKKWEFTTGGAILSTPAISTDEKSLYFGSKDSKFYGINTLDGLQQFAYTASGAISTSPTIADDNNIYFVTNNYIYCLYPNGLEKFKNSIDSFQQRGYTTTKSVIYNNPVIDSNGNIYLGCNFTHHNPNKTWWEIYSYNNMVCIDSNKTLKYEILLFNGEPSQDYKTIYNTFSTPIISQDNHIYFGSTNNNIYSVNSTGKAIWQYQTGGAINSSPAIAVDGTLYIGCDDGKLYAMSNLQIPPSITLTSPVGGELWLQGSTRSITWNSTNVTGNVKIELFKGGVLNSTIIGDTQNNGTFDWKIPGNQALGIDYKVKISSIADNTINNQSTNNFSITSGTVTKATITITSPNGGQQWLQSTNHPITWTSTGTPGNVKIELLKGGALNRTLSTSTANTGSFNWNILATQATGTDYQVKISAVSDATIISQSAVDFAITAGTNNNATITITSPNGSEQLTQGTANPITWTSTGTPGNVKIELFKGGILNRTISTSTSNTGSFNWNILATQATGTDYQIKISAVTNNTINSQSAGDFEIIAGTPTATIFVTSPIGSEQWLQNSTHPITWSSTGNPGNVKIELLKNGVLNSVIAANIPDSGTYNWSIPQNQATGTDYQVRISAVANLQVTNQSAANFSILPGGNNPTLTAPKLYLPANNSINVPVPTKFIWSAVLNAVSYNIQLADDAQFAINMQENNITSINASTTGLTPGATYYWRVQALDNNGDTGAWSEVYVFKTITTPITYQYRPDLSITPANGTTVGTDIYDVSGYTQWATLGASTTVPATYTITVTNNGTSDDVITLFSNSGVNGWKHTFVDVTGTDITAEISSTTGHSITLTAGASEDITLSTLAGPAGSSYLSIMGKSKNLNSSFDTVVARAFKTDNNAPVFPRPVLTSPANNTVISGPLSWSSLSTSTGYQIQVSTDADFRNPEFDNFVTNPNDTVGTLADDTTYYWRVRATDSDLALPASQYHWSEWSHVSLFRTVAATTAEAFDVNIYSKSLSSTPITMNPGDNNNQNPITQGAKIRNSASYYVAITNRGNVKSQFTISDSTVLPSDSKLNGWRINITDMRANNITRKIFNSGSGFTTPFVDPGKKIYIRVEVAAGSNTSIGDSADANISISSTNGTVDLFTTTVRE